MFDSEHHAEVDSEQYCYQCDSQTGMVKFLGRGTYGRVYLVRKVVPDGQCRDFYALKVLDCTSLNACKDSISQAKFLADEMKKKWKATIRLKHENLVKYYGAEVREGDFKHMEGFLVLEYCAFADLGKYLDKLRQDALHKTLSPAATKCCIKDILQGLRYLHAYKIMHTDLKPSNILLADTTNGIVAKIGDIDDHLAIYTHTIIRSEIKRPLGTVKYMSPEIIDLVKGDVPVKAGRKMDMWSFGAIVVEMSRGDKPFRFVKLKETSGLTDDYLEVSNGMPAIKIMNFVLENGAPEIPAESFARNFSGLRQCLCRSGDERPAAEELLKDAWLSQEEIIHPDDKWFRCTSVAEK